MEIPHALVLNPLGRFRIHQQMKILEIEILKIPAHPTTLAQIYL